MASNSSNFAWSAWCVASSVTPLLLSSKPVGAGGAGLEVDGPEVGDGPAEHAVATRLRPKAATPIKVFMAPSGASCESANLCLLRRHRQTAGAGLRIESATTQRAHPTAAKSAPPSDSAEAVNSQSRGNTKAPSCRHDLS